METITINEKIKEILSLYSSKSIEKMKATLEGQGKIAKGALLESLKYQVMSDSRVQINMEGYGKFVNDGRAPGTMPPIDAIKDWCQIKGIPEEAAFPIAKSIEEYGTKGTHFIDSFFAGIAELSNELTDEIGKVLITEFKNEIEKVNIK